MKTILSQVEIYPKVVRSRTRATVYVRGLGTRITFSPDTRYTVQITPLDDRTQGKVYDSTSHDGVLPISADFGAEGAYNLRIAPNGDNPGQSWPLELRVYALDADLFAQRPWRGNMHCHSYHSDGQESPAFVAASDRSAGYDYLSISDHGQYEPSIEAINTYKDVKIDLCLYPGEEVHPPDNGTHYLHFGGTYSVNRIFRDEPGRYERERDRIMEDLKKAGDPWSAHDLFPLWASTLWVARQIHRAGGLAIMVHPHWIHEGAYHVPAELAGRMLTEGEFDAFELLGGQTVQENLTQVALWQEARAEGHFIPPLGLDDSHGSVNALWFGISKTVVFAPSPGNADLQSAIRSGQCVALEQYAGEALPRIYGTYRFVSYALFLEEEYFPLHDRLCVEEGRLMHAYITGDADAAQQLAALSGRCAALQKRLWAAP
jgi:hypothetical protein